MIRTSKYKYLIILSIAAMGLFFYLTKGLPGGYVYIDYTSVVDSIELDGKTVVSPMVLQVAEADSFIVGLKLPIDYRKCHHKHEDGRNTFSKSVEVLYLPEFFIIFSENGEVSRFKSQEKFEVMLENLGISDKINLDYSAFNKFWDGLPKTAHWDNFAKEDCPIPSKEDHEYSLSIMLDVDSGFRTIDELHATLH